MPWSVLRLVQYGFWKTCAVIIHSVENSYTEPSIALINQFDRYDQTNFKHHPFLFSIIAGDEAFSGLSSKKISIKNYLPLNCLNHSIVP